MSSKAEKKRYRKLVSDLMRKYAQSLKSTNVLHDIKAFEEAAKQCLDGLNPVIAGIKIDNNNSWGYELRNVILKVPKKSKTKGILPEGANVNTITFSAKIIGNYISSTYAEDPFSHIELNIIAKGKSSDGSDMLACWHFDRDLKPKTGSKKPLDAHPIYHFQFAGKNLKLPNDNYGEHLVLDTPRIMHLPLDAILGFDFVLSNFLGGKRNMLKTNKPYANCLKEVQKQFWRPYVHSVAKEWDSYDRNNYKWDVNEICPQIF